MHLHDWEILEYQNKNDIEEKYGLTKIQHNLHPYVRTKICLKCGKHVDEITPYVNKITEQKNKLEGRKKLAEILYKVEILSKDIVLEPKDIRTKDNCFSHPEDEI